MTKEEILIKALNDRCKYESGKEMDYDTHLAIMDAMDEYAQQQVKNYTIPDVNWQKLTNDNLPKQESWILITDGTDWRRVYVTNQFEFVEHPDDKVAYSQGITHWCKVTLPKVATNGLNIDS